VGGIIGGGRRDEIQPTREKKQEDIHKYILQQDRVKNNAFVGVVQLVIIHFGACISIIILTNLISSC
jgi:hypothetical protein